ncbi:MAG: LON peptidase substrate-binding domain-containing protein, partial [Desulfobacterales bacterium]|nr:LON peptidase substrate-binding domain-containing protein [Desulfobacterales bacterium]
MAETDKDDLIRILEDDEENTEIPGKLPLMPVRDVVIFTGMVLPLLVGREKSVQAVEEAVQKDGLIFLATQKDLGVEDPKSDDIYPVGTVSRILRMLKLPDGRIKALVQGVVKAKVIGHVSGKPFFTVKIETISEKPTAKINLEIEALMRNVREQSEKILALLGEFSEDVKVILAGIDDPGKLADLVASNLKLKT